MEENRKQYIHVQDPKSSKELLFVMADISSSLNVLLLLYLVVLCMC